MSQSTEKQTEMGSGHVPKVQACLYSHCEKETVTEAACDPNSLHAAL